MNQEAKVAQDLNKLILSIRPNASIGLQTNIKIYSKKVLGSYVSRPTNQSAQSIKQKIITRVSNTSDSKSVLQCQQAINKIMISNTIDKKAQVLKMLIKTSDLLNKNTKNYSSIFKESKVQTVLNQTQQTISPSNNTFISSFMKQRKPPTHEQIVGLRNRGAVDQGISESDILKQITYTLQNIEANLIVQDPTNEIYQLQQNIHVSETVRKIVSQLCDVGWLYKKITSSLSDKGSIEKSLLLAVQEELNQYYRWLAIIENMIKQNQLSLRKLILWSYEPMQKLKWLAIVLQATQPYQGCQIISIINSYRPQGSQSINQLLNRLLGHLVQPLLQFIHNWVYKGQLMDDYKQFFVEQHKKVNEYFEWYQKYSLVYKNIPNILDKESARMIFNAGKTLYFLKYRCKCNYALSIPFINPDQILNKQICQSSNILSVEFKKWLKNVYEDLSQKLVSVLNKQFNFKHHLNSMKYFYLMGKGDFIQQLADSLKEQMLKPKHQIYQHTLDGYISDALSKSFTDFNILRDRQQKIGQKMKQKITFENSYRANIIDRLLAKKVDLGGGTAWEVFNFQYSMDRIQPLYSILTPQCIINYQRIFNFLWKVKRIEEALKQIWMLHQKQYSRKKPSKNQIQFSKLLQRCHLLRSSMSHFLNNLYGYLMIAIESAWDRFSQELNKAQSLDEIIQQHLALQRQILSITFNGTKKNTLHSLTNIFVSIEQFKALETRIHVQYSEFLQKARAYENRKRIAQIGIMKMEIESEMLIPEFDPEELSNRLAQIDEIYNSTFKTFYDQLKKEHPQASVLIFRLDFSEYFTMKEINENFFS